MKYQKTLYGPMLDALVNGAETFGTLEPGHEDTLAPGVRGHTVEHEGAIYIPVIAAEYPGHGLVGNYLDSLPRDRRIVFPCVLSKVLHGMLARRGFVAGREWSEDAAEWVDIMERCGVTA